MKKQALAIAIASAMAAPSAFAAQDTSGMHYTSASEGFYASIRTVWSSSGNAQGDFDGDSNQGAHIGGSFSRFGVSGTNDLGGGLEGFYGFEARVDHLQNASTKLRLANVGLRGNFGEIVAGSFWNNLYSFSYGATDVANNYSGHFLGSGGNNGGISDFPNRINNAFQYTTPDLNGFQGSFVVVSGDSNGTGERCVDVSELGNTEVPSNLVSIDAGTGAVTIDQEALGTLIGALPTTGSCAANDIRITGTNSAADNNDIDGWGLAGKYDVQGFSVGASYLNNADGLSGDGRTDDQVVWTVKLGYAQDNWYVNGWYGEKNDSDTPVATDAAKEKDTEYFSVAGGVSVDKVNVYVVYEQSEQDSESTYGTVGVQYNLGSRSRTFVEYNDQDTKDATDEGSFLVGLRHDF